MSVNLTGTNLEGFDIFNVTSSINNNSLLLLNMNSTINTSVYIGKNWGISFNVVDERNKSISGASCSISVEDGNGFPYLVSYEKSINGRVTSSIILDKDTFAESTSYLASAQCYCGVSGTQNSCVDSDGLELTTSIGSSQIIFRTNNWLTINSVTNKLLYQTKEEIFICANVTNPNALSPVFMHILYLARCSAYNDSSDDTDRVLITNKDQPEVRQILNSTTQMQCIRFRIPEPKYMQGHNNTCYASTIVYVINSDEKTLVTYFTNTPIFNITSKTINVNPDWVFDNLQTYNTTINLSAAAFDDLNGSGYGDLDIRLDITHIEKLDSTEQQEGEIINFNDFLRGLQIKSIVATNLTGQNVPAFLEILDDGMFEIELRDVDISRSGYYTVIMDMYHFDEMVANATKNLTVSQGLSYQALEAISNKTGTFHLSLNCPSKAYVNEQMSCFITAQIEDTQTVQKEVDFTCYIVNGTTHYSNLNLNQMVNRTAITIQTDFNVPNLIIGQQYVAECVAHYDNFGGRDDTFSDSFQMDSIQYANPSPSSSDGGISIPEETHNFNDDIEEFIQKEIIEGNRTWRIYSLAIFMIAGLLIGGYCLKKRNFG